MADDAREEILGRIRLALSDVPASERTGDVAVTRSYRVADDRPRAELVALFAERADDYTAEVRRTPAERLPAAIATAVAELGVTRAAVAPGVPPEWLPESLPVVTDDGLDVAALDELDAAITGCAAAIAETGTIVLDGGPLSGRRALTLIGDRHICVVAADQIHGQLPAALAAVADAVALRRAPITLVSGPSATSDIELERVEGVHGPRRLVVLIAE
ncbi:MAG TPA: LUD domain-containing protein [Solirubrobacteraceae bacterium]|nr:LUD domain-containing protein [Solirubrobacteraceae bacterium]